MRLTANNPILLSEFKYQRFVIQNSRSGWMWILLAILMLVPALVGAVIYFLGLVFGLIETPSWFDIPYTWHYGLSINLFVVAVSLSVVVTLVTFGLANGSIRREKDKHTWALLRLSNIDNGKIILGKWWASLWALNGDNAMMVILRVGALAMGCALYIPAWQAAHGLGLPPYRLYFLLLLPFIVLQALFDAALSASLGVVSAIPDEAWASIVGSSITVLRLFLSIALVYWYYLIISEMSNDFFGVWMLAIYGTLVTLILLLLSLLSAKWLLDYF